MSAGWLDRESFSELTSPNPRTLRVVIGLQLVSSLVHVLALVIILTAGVQLPVGPLLLIVAAFALWNVVSWMHSGRLATDMHCERHVLLQLTVTTVVLAGLLYFTGGATSPFVSLFLVPVAIGALSLSMPLALAIAALAASAYTLLLFFHVPLTAQHVHGEAGFNFHVIGMWLNFLGSGAVLLLFLGILARVARERANALAALRERQMRAEQVVAMAGVAAGAAHAIATPLSTLSILLDELDDTGFVNDEIRVAKEQLHVVRERLDEILRSVHPGMDAHDLQNLRELVGRLARQWHHRRPESDLRIDNLLPDIEAAIDPAFGHGLATLLDNAADANASVGATRVLLRAHLASGRLQVEVEDEGGASLPQSPPARTGHKSNGHGAGLMILRTNLERLGGSLHFDRGARGCVARFIVPLATA